MNHNLDEIFRKAAELSDKAIPIHKSVLLQLLTKKPFYVKHFKGILIMTIILSAFIVILLLNPSQQVSQKIAADGHNVGVTTKIQDESKGKIQKSSDNTQQITPELNKKTESSDSKNRTQAKSIQLSYVTYPDAELNITRPFKTEKKETYSKVEFSTSKREGYDLLEPASLKTGTGGEAITGLMELELTQSELEALGILANDEKIEFSMEEMMVIHPIPFRNRLEYHYNYRAYPYYKAGYPANGDFFLVKRRYDINLNYKYNPEMDTVYEDAGYSSDDHKTITQVIDGKEITMNPLIIVYSKESRIIGMTETQWYEAREKSNIGLSNKLLPYSGWTRDSYSKSVPVSFAMNYNPIERKVYKISQDSPLLSEKDQMYEIDYTKLLPVSLVYNNTKLISKIVFWFVPTREFISLLPERYKTSLMTEVQAVESIESGSIPAEKACQAVRDASFLDICRINSGAITIEKLYPNPVYYQSTISFRLSEPRIITIDLHDVEGKYIGSLMKTKALNQGKYNMEIDTKDIRPGIYLIAVKSESAEIATIKIIKN